MLSNARWHATALCFNPSDLFSPEYHFDDYYFYYLSLPLPCFLNGWLYMFLQDQSLMVSFWVFFPRLPLSYFPFLFVCKGYYTFPKAVHPIYVVQRNVWSLLCELIGCGRMKVDRFGGGMMCWHYKRKNKKVMQVRSYICTETSKCQLYNRQGHAAKFHIWRRNLVKRKANQVVFE